MKILLHTALLVSLIVVVSSCSSSKPSGYQSVYNAQATPTSGMADLGRTQTSTNRNQNKDCCGTNEATFTADLRTIPRYTGTQVVPVAPVQVEPPVAPVQVEPPVAPISSRPVAFKKGKLTAVDPRDADKLRLYNAVVVTLSKPENVEKLKRKFERDGEYFFLAKNVQGWIYFIVWSSDDREETIERRHQFVDRYTGRYTPKELQRLYGMPFTDAWIQLNE